MNEKISENNKKEREPSNADHRTLGEQLDFFSIVEEVGVGLVLWHPKGTIVRNIIRDYWESEHLKNGYDLVCTPHIARRELWSISGHLDYYAENMYLFEKDGEPYVVKPMNCPLHVQIYKSKPRSYKELPIRYAEWGTVYRYERSGTLHGLLRVRGFTQDDAHIFCTPEQLNKEILRTLDFSQYLLKKFGFQEFNVVLSTRDPKHTEKYMGSEKDWNMAQEALANALKKRKIPYRKMEGEAVFYGPKIDVNIVDASGKEWQCTTIQFDFNLPKRFKIAYVGKDGKEHFVFMIHRALLGAIERFFAILIEHYKGVFPTWLAPTQAIILPITDDQLPYANLLYRKMQAQGIRAEIDRSASTLNYKIRNAELQKIPNIVIVGKKETESNKISIRKRGIGNTDKLPINKFIEIIKNECT